MHRCYYPGCDTERAEGGFCDAHYAAMYTPRERMPEQAPRYDDTLCPCGEPAERDGVCAPCYARHRPLAFSD